MTTQPAEPQPAEPDGPLETALDRVAVILSTTFGAAVVIITLALLSDAIRAPEHGLSENGTQLLTQVLTTAFGGIIGVLGSHLGYRSGERKARAGKRTRPDA